VNALASTTWLLAALPFGMDGWDVAISIGIFASVVLLVSAVFSQPGRIHMSPEREAALATGHTDRRTVFESRTLRPLMWVLLAVAHRLAVPRTKRWLRGKLVATGNEDYYTPEEALARSLLTGLVLGGAVAAFVFLLAGELSLFAAGVGLFLGVFLSLYQLAGKARARVRLISKRVPYALDLIALAMGAGATFVEAVRTVVRENPDDPFNVELKALLAEMDLGTTRRAALENLAARIPLEMLRSVVASVIQAEELGTPLADVLHSQANLLRLQRSVRAENAAAVASVRILVPALLLVVAIMLVIFGPAILRAVRGGLL